MREDTGPPARPGVLFFWKNLCGEVRGFWREVYLRKWKDAPCGRRRESGAAETEKTRE